MIRKVLVFRRICRVIAVKFNVKTLEISEVLPMHFFNKLLGSDAKLRCLDLNRSAVRVIRAAVNHILANQLKEANKNIRLNILH